MDDQPPSVWSLRPELPFELDEIVARALAKEPGERYASCAELTEAARLALAPTEPWWRSRRMLALAAALVAVALAAALAVVVARGGTEPAEESSVTLAGDSLVRLDAATGEIIAAVPLEGNPLNGNLRPVGLAGDDRNVWVADEGRTISRIDALANDVSAIFDVPDARVGPGPLVDGIGVQAAGGDIWVTTERWELLRSRAGAEVLEPVELPFHYTETETESPPQLSGGSVWVTTDGQLLRIDPDTGAILARLGDLFPTEIVGDGFLWAIAAEGNWGTWVRVDTDTNEITPLPEFPLMGDGSPQPSFGAVVGEGSVWLPNVENGILRLDEMTGRVQGHYPFGLFTVGRGAFWVGGRAAILNYDGTVRWSGEPGETISRIDLESGEVQTIDVGGQPMGLAFAAGDVWVAVDA